MSRRSTKQRRSARRRRKLVQAAALRRFVDAFFRHDEEIKRLWRGLREDAAALLHRRALERGFVARRPDLPREG